MYKLLNVGQNVKTLKSDKMGQYLTGILYLAPGRISGYETCPAASEGCRKACLYTAGFGDRLVVKRARIKKTQWFFEDKTNFMDWLVKDIEQLVKTAKKTGVKPAVRLNGTSDIEWEKVNFAMYANIMEKFPKVQFYDYTKITGRVDLPKNYHLTFSLAEDNMKEAREALLQGFNVSAVFQDSNFPFEFMGRPVIDGDKHDLRFLDPKGVIVGLKAKGEAKYDELGFVQNFAGSSKTLAEVGA